MRYTIAALAAEGLPVQRLVDILISRGIDRARINLSTTRPVPPSTAPPEILLTVKTMRLDEQQLITDALRAGGGRSITSAEESSALNAV